MVHIWRMTTDRAMKLAAQLARAVMSGGPYSDAAIEARIRNQVAELLLV